MSGALFWFLLTGDTKWCCMWNEKLYILGIFKHGGDSCTVIYQSTLYSQLVAPCMHHDPSFSVPHKININNDVYDYNIVDFRPVPTQAIRINISGKSSMSEYIDQ